MNIERKMMHKKKDSPNLKDVLRQKFRTRIKNSRAALIERFRKSTDDTLRNIMQEDIQGLNEDTLMELEVDNNEENTWLLQEYEKFLESEENYLNNEVICPLCQKSVLKHSGKNAYCQRCCSNFPSTSDLLTLQKLIQSSVKLHEDNCPEYADFALLKELDGLFLICQTCQLFRQIV